MLVAGLKQRGRTGLLRLGHQEADSLAEGVAEGVHKVAETPRQPVKEGPPRRAFDLPQSPILPLRGELVVEAADRLDRSQLVFENHEARFVVPLGILVWRVIKDLQAVREDFEFSPDSPAVLEIDADIESRKVSQALVASAPIDEDPRE